MLSADGYQLDLTDEGDEAILASITAGPDACADCLVPKEMMKIYFDSALREALGDEAPDVSLAYPADHVA